MGVGEQIFVLVSKLFWDVIHITGDFILSYMILYYSEHDFIIIYGVTYMSS